MHPKFWMQRMRSKSQQWLRAVLKIRRPWVYKLLGTPSSDFQILQSLDSQAKFIALRHAFPLLILVKLSTYHTMKPNNKMHFIDVNFSVLQKQKKKNSISNPQETLCFFCDFIKEMTYWHDIIRAMMGKYTSSVVFTKFKKN